MEFVQNERSKTKYLVFLIAISFLLLACLITLFVDVNGNKGVIPLIFILLSLYSLITFLYHLLYLPIKLMRGYKTNIKIIYLIFLIINILLFILSSLTLWT